MQHRGAENENKITTTTAAAAAAAADNVKLTDTLTHRLFLNSQNCRTEQTHFVLLFLEAEQTLTLWFVSLRVKVLVALVRLRAHTHT